MLHIKIIKIGQCFTELLENISLAVFLKHSVDCSSAVRDKSSTGMSKKCTHRRSNYVTHWLTELTNHAWVCWNLSYDC